MTNLRPDLQTIADLVVPETKVLDLGCGDGALLEYLVRHKQVQGRGIELSEPGILACVRRGLSVRQGSLEEGLADCPKTSFDYVILSQTLPFLDDPPHILQEMLRVGRQAIISFPNWGYWRCRLQFFFTGCIPNAPDLPQRWYEIPRWQALSITDFAHLCRKLNIRITQQAYLTGQQRRQLRFFKNLLATTAVFTLETVSQ